MARNCSRLSLAETPDNFIELEDNYFAKEMAAKNTFQGDFLR